MSLAFFDINFCVGRCAMGGYRPAVSTDDAVRLMDDLGMTGALAWHVAQHDASASIGNALLNDFIAPNQRLLGSWTVLPPQTGEQKTGNAFFEDMRSHAVCALRVFPLTQRFLLNRVVFGDFMDEIVQRKIPLMLSLGRGHVAWEQVYALLGEYPELTCILCDTGIWASDRYFRPLLEAYRNVYMETSLLALGDGVTEKLVEDYGARRLLFGSGFPEREPAAAMLQLLHADIADEHKLAIAGANAKRLIDGADL